MGPRLTCLVVPAVLALVGGAPAAAPPSVALDSYGDRLPPGAVARLGTARLCCKRARCLAFSGDGKTLVSGGADACIHVWGTRTGKELRRFKGQPSAAGCLAVSPDGTRVAVAPLRDNGIYLHDLATGKLVRSFRGHPEPAAHLAFSPDGKWLASTCRDNPTLVWDVATGRQLRSLATSGSDCPLLPGPAVAFSCDGKYLAVSVEEPTKGSQIPRPMIDLWDTSSWKVVRGLKGHRRVVIGLAFTPDGKQLISGGLDLTIRLWDVGSGKQLRSYGEELGGVCGVVLAQGGKVVAAGNQDGRVRAWDTASAKELWSVDLRRVVETIAVSPDGKTLAVATDTRISLWEAATGKPTVQSPEAADAVSSVRFTPDGKGLVVIREDDSVEQWDVRAWLRRSRTNVEEGILALRVLPGRGMVAASEIDVNTDKERLELRSVPAGRLVGSFPVQAYPWARARGAIAILPDGDRVVVQTDRGAYLWSASRKVTLQHFAGGEKGPVALSEDGALLANTAPGGGLVLWHTETGALLAQVGQQEGKVSALRFSPDGRSLLTWDGEGPQADLRLWEVASGKLRLRLKCRHSVFEAAFSPDGRLLALSGAGGVSLHDLTGGKEVSQLDVYRGSAPGLAFSPDGELLATGGEDTTVLVWRTSRLVGPRKPSLTSKLSAERADELWQDLGSADAGRAHRAIWAWANHPEQAIAFFGPRLRKADVPAATVRRLIRQLDDDSFEVREKASRELETLGRSVGPELRQALNKAPSLELALRLRRLLRNLLPCRMSGEALRQHRAVEALARINTPEARRLLGPCAAGR